MMNIHLLRTYFKDAHFYLYANNFLYGLKGPVSTIMMKLFSVAIFASLFFASHQQSVGVHDIPVAEGCWTDWFDRDTPSARRGDWETLASLHAENPGKICKKPRAVEAQTLTGLSPGLAGDVIYISDTTRGFVCLNRDQKEKICNDYRVRFSCPPSFCEVKVCWTQWFNRDDSRGTGDFETLSRLQKDNPGKICPSPLAIEAETLTGLSPAEAGDVIYENDPYTGFICRNKDQKQKRFCYDYRVRFSCPLSFCEVEVCWTQWFDRDDPSGSGDLETLYSLQKDNPGKICPSPEAIEAQTLTGLTPAAAGDVIYKNDLYTGFICRNDDQKEKKFCSDYRVRFSCPLTFCEVQVCWTKWFDRDDPSGTGDLETLYSLQKDNPGKICPSPEAIETQTLTGLSPAEAGDVIYKNDTTTGFICRNIDQKEKICNDYRVRFSCPLSYCHVQECWTEWFNEDDPSGTGDFETLSSLREENPGEICEKPLFIEAVTTDTNTPSTSTGDIFSVSSPTRGFICRNQDQKSGQCRDYKVRFWCPC